MALNSIKGINRYAWGLYLGIGFLVIGVYYALPTAGAGQAALLPILIGSASVITLGAAKRAHGTTRTVWVAMGAALVLATLANAAHFAGPLITKRPNPFPSPIDALWILMYSFFIIGLVVLARQRRRNERRGDALDAAVMIVAGTILMWEFIIASVFKLQGIPLFAHILSIAYPVLVLIIFAVLVRLIVAGLHRTGAAHLLLASFVALLVADLVYAVQLASGTYARGGITGGMWMAAYLLIGVAAMHPSALDFPRAARSNAPRVTHARFIFLCCAAVTGPLVMVAKGHDIVFVACASIISFLLVLARLTGVNQQLVSVSSQLETRATTDALTGLANRPRLYERIEASIMDVGARISFLLIDLDDFKAVNDVAGHVAGDAVLVEVADRLRSVVREGDVVARLGGDEFAILVNISADGQDVAKRVLGAFERRFKFGEREFTLGASVGLVTASGMNLGHIIQNADIAMYTAKRRGKNRAVTFDNSMYTELLDRSELANELETALRNEEFRIAYQPIVRLDNGVPVGVEALARWSNTRLGEIPPTRFIPIAEESGAIVPLGRWILRTALQDLAVLDESTQTSLNLNVNVSSRQLLEPKFCDDVAKALADSGIDPLRLTLEVTESAMIEENSDSIRQLHALRALGVRISLDDFGTGYSSLAYLRRLPMEGLKIDRAFVEGVDHGIEEAAVAKAILRIAETLGLSCIAEGVERKEQVGPLRAAGCEFAQGFFFARPMALERLTDFLHRRPQDPDTSRGTVLIADSDPFSGPALERRLRAVGFETMQAHNANEALSILRSRRIDLLILCETLPEGQRMELCRILRSDRSFGYCPILVLTKDDQESDSRVRSLAMGADSFLPTTADPNELTATVRSLLRPVAVLN
jgi:diguanylate cyclase (GGDEF)-like protein